jgi:hypothetical protein
MVRRVEILRARRRRAARGATLVVVVLVVTLLMGIGAFAARSAHLATTSSGYERHQTQTRYVAEYGLMMTTSLLASPSGQSYMKAMGGPGSPPADRCFGQVAAAMPTPTCYKTTYADIELLTTGFKLCEAAAAAYPGSLGMAGAQYNAQCDFGVELTDKVAGYTPSGNPPSGGLKFWYVTASVTAQVRLVSAPGALDPISAESSSTQTLRSRILAGPFPAL